MARTARVGVLRQISENELDTQVDRAIANEAEGRINEIKEYKRRFFRQMQVGLSDIQENSEPLEEVPSGEIPESPLGEVPSGEIPESPLGEVSSGEIPESSLGEVSSGEIPEPVFRESYQWQGRDIIGEDWAKFGVGRGDARYHRYTGRGLEAKHKSEMYKTETLQVYTESEHGSFREHTIQSLRAEYDAKIRQKEGEIQESINQITAMKTEHREYKTVMKAYYDVLDLDFAIEQKKKLEKLSIGRADYFGLELEALSEEYEKTIKQLADLINAGNAIKEESRKLLNTRNAAREKLFFSLSTGQTGTFAERKQNRQRNIMKDCCQKLLINKEKWNTNKNSIEDYFQSLAEIIGQYRNMDKQKREMVEVAEQFKNMAQAQEAERKNILRENGANLRADWFVEALSLEDKKRALVSVREKLRERKEEVTQQGRQADLLLLPAKDRNVEGIYIDGRLFLQEPGEGDFQAPIQYDEQEMKIIIEEQKIVTALKQREIFQYINSDNLMEYLTYDEDGGDFLLPRTAGAETSQTDSAEPLSRGQSAWRGFSQGAVNLSKWGLNTGADVLGIARFIQAADAGRTQDNTWTDAQASQIATGALNLLYYASLASDLLAEGIAPAAIPQIVHESVWGNLALAGLDLTKASRMSVLGGIGAALNIGNGLARGIFAEIDKEQMRGAADEREALGQRRYGRILREAAVEKAVQEFEGFMDAIMGGVSATFSLTGIGGLAATGITVLSNILIKKVVGALRRKAQQKEVLDSNEVLGGINYDKNLISDDDFTLLLANVTGIKSRNKLYKAIKITDSIHVHYAMKKSMAIPDPDIDSVMRALGFGNRSRYKDIKLKDVQKKLGYSGDWKEELHHVMEIRGIDYDTNFTRFVKGVRGMDYYRNQKKLKRPSRQEVMQARRDRLNAGGGN